MRSATEIDFYINGLPMAENELVQVFNSFMGMCAMQNLWNRNQNQFLLVISGSADGM